jgi:hypothetical protein
VLTRQGRLARAWWLALDLERWAVLDLELWCSCYFRLNEVLLLVVSAGKVQGGASHQSGVVSVWCGCFRDQGWMGSLASSSGLVEVWCRAWPAVRVL